GGAFGSAGGGRAPAGTAGGVGGDRRAGAAGFGRVFAVFGGGGLLGFLGAAIARRQGPVACRLLMLIWGGEGVVRFFSFCAMAGCLFWCLERLGKGVGCVGLVRVGTSGGFGSGWVRVGW
ncbi:hypothetical protein TraAM80_05686, partial [Trypanosoma rangeli]